MDSDDRHVCLWYLRAPVIFHLTPLWLTCSLAYPDPKGALSRFISRKHLLHVEKIHFR